MSRFLNERFLNLEAYVPGEQPQDKKYIKLNTNEMPYPPSSGVVNAVSQTADTLNLYPDPTGKALKEKLSETYGVSPENVFLSNGSDEILSFAFMSFFDKGVAFADITYGFYKVYAELYGVNAEIIPLKEDFSIDPAEYENARGGVVIANLNAPTGRVLSAESIERIVKSAGGIVIIDEAYADFGDVSCVKLTEKYDNLIIVRTYSKSRAMAGARLGFAIANKQVIDDLEKIKFSTNPYNINRLTLRAGVAALEDEEYYKACISKIRDTREYVSDELKKLGFDVQPSQANFIFAKSAQMSGEMLYSKLKNAGILVRHFTGERIKEYIRITIGTREQMEALISEVKRIREA